MDSRSEMRLDDLDWSILRELQADARLSYAQLGRRVNLSPPAVAERVRRLEREGVITGYGARIEPARVGQPVAMFVQLRCRLGSCLLRTSAADDYPEVVEVHKLTGEHCTMLKVRATSLEHLEGLLERLGNHGALSTSLVLSTQYEGRPVEPAPEDFQRATDSAGWRRPDGP
ncbi:Lrp/AsnC family transcriptional regulator [Streptomyces sp. A7024]|uniref:Lrp/AsnC family transcriptional regulator n=1 Tax=Streptomyces coryli TaxID=1128680 RepID=A0A6G4UCU1_9ACTN|nr:Lrp/AsnC family transcriptional regulator [Streptomyces coryli]NGN70055.1 Lrp/AsnC family transcriptional regulator [Streptomyces coryli]